MFKSDGPNWAALGPLDFARRVFPSVVLPTSYRRRASARYCSRTARSSTRARTRSRAGSVCTMVQSASAFALRSLAASTRTSDPSCSWSSLQPAWSSPGQRSQWSSTTRASPRSWRGVGVEGDPRRFVRELVDCRETSRAVGRVWRAHGVARVDAARMVEAIGGGSKASRQVVPFGRDAHAAWMVKIAVGTLPTRVLLHEQWPASFPSPNCPTCMVAVDGPGHFLVCCDAQNEVADAVGHACAKGTMVLPAAQRDGATAALERYYHAAPLLMVAGIVLEDWVRDWTDACEYKAALLSDAITAFSAVIREQVWLPRCTRAAELVPRLATDPPDPAEPTRSHAHGQRRAHTQLSLCCFADVALATSSPDHVCCRNGGLLRRSLVCGDAEFARACHGGALSMYHDLVDLEPLCGVQPPTAP